MPRAGDRFTKGGWTAKWSELLDQMEEEWHSAGSDGMRQTWWELVHRAVESFSETVPPEAQDHLVNAQHEFIEAVRLVMDHHRNSGPKGRSSRRTRVRRIDVE